MTLPRIIQGSAPIHFERHGDKAAPCLVMVLGLGMHLQDWPRALLRDLARDFFLICVENRDMGQSCRYGPDNDPAAVSQLMRDPAQNAPYTLFDMRDDVLRVVDALNVDRFAVVGFSMGGMVAQLVAAQGGHRITGMAQICSSAGEAKLPTMPSTWDRFIRTAQPFDTPEELADWLTEDQIWWSTPTPLSEDAARQVASDMIAGGFSSGGYARQLQALYGSGDRQAELRKITAPALVIGGAQDHCIVPDSSRRAHAAIAGSKLVLFEAMGHALAPQATHHLKTWLGRTVLGRARADVTEAGGMTQDGMA